MSYLDDYIDVQDFKESINKIYICIAEIHRLLNSDVSKSRLPELFNSAIVNFERAKKLYNKLDSNND